MSATATSDAVGGAILAGGSSTRMGTHKALIQIEGSTMVERCARALAATGVSPVLVVGGPQIEFERLGLGHLPDAWPGEGPLGGAITALDALKTELVIVLSCDLLQPSPEAIGELIGEVDGHDLAVPLAAGRPQWLHSVWRRSILETVRHEFYKGARSIHSGTSGLDIHFFEGADPISYGDADYPSDLPESSSLGRADTSDSLDENP